MADAFINPNGMTSPSLYTTTRISYSRDALISLNLHNTHRKPSLIPDPRWPTEILRENKGREARKRPQGKRNVQSLDNKLEDLWARIKFQRDIRDYNLLCFTEL
ncbi:hypothetical protein P4O66_002034 [Electrophorus voltai]|uniref:Uncharacterized protein n=1 Tax=Electrophorus voltai TaxID=2609070 RepID=A0AAD9DS10_9TELE|nr:hypothetical protein P4O66_002034 [Electrophorus voltai]